RIFQVVPFVVLGLAIGSLAIWWERYHQGTSRAIFTFLSPIERILVASRAVWFYLSKLVWPSKLTFIYPRWDIASTHLLGYVWLLAGLIGCVVIYFLRRYLGRSIEVAAAFFVATLRPVLGFIMLYSFRYTFVADHYQYLACIGPIALVSAGIVTLADKWKKTRPLTLGLAVCVLAALWSLSLRQGAMYGDIEALWRTTLAKNPNCWMAHNNLGIVLFEKNQIDEAIAQYRATLNLQPDFWDADYNLGNALLGKGEIDRAMVHCRAAVSIQPQNADAQTNLAVVLDQKGRAPEAISHYEKALELSSRSLSAENNLAWLLATNSDASLRNSARALELA